MDLDSYFIILIIVIIGSAIYVAKRIEYRINNRVYATPVSITVSVTGTKKAWNFSKTLFTSRLPEVGHLIQDNHVGFRIDRIYQSNGEVSAAYDFDADNEDEACSYMIKIYNDGWKYNPPPFSDELPEKARIIL